MPHFELNSVPHHHDADSSSLQLFTLSYSAVNLWIYFVVIPITWTLVLDRKLRTNYLITLAYCVLLLFAGPMEYNNKIDIFQAGVNFCVYMQSVHHCSYAESCIIWCILVPLAVTIILISLPQRASTKSIIA